MGAARGARLTRYGLRYSIENEIESEIDIVRSLLAGPSSWNISHVISRGERVGSMGSHVTDAKIFQCEQGLEVQETKEIRQQRSATSAR